MTKVHCTVNDCEYWTGPNLCEANEILIAGKPFEAHDINHHGKDVPQDLHTPVDRKDGTFCYTFEKETGAA